MTKTYKAQIEDLMRRRNAELRRIAAESIQDVVEAAQTTQRGVTRGASGFVEGKIPVADEDLVTSLKSGVDGGTSDLGKTSYLAVIAGMEIGDRLTFEWTVKHALPMETGFSIERKDGGVTEVPGRHFVGANVVRFSEFVDRRAREVKS